MIEDFNTILEQNRLLKAKFENQQNEYEALKRENEQLKLNADSFKNIYNTLTEAVYILNKDWIIIDVNKGAEFMYGYSRDELIGKTAGDLAAPGKNDLEYIDNLWADVLENGGKRVFDFWALRKNGELFFKEVITNRGIYFGQTALIVTARDVTERKKAEQEIHKFKTVSDSAVHGNAIVDLQGNILYINDYFANVHGYTAEELIGKNLSEFHTKEYLPEVKLINKGLVENGSYSSERVIHVHKNGTEFPMLMNGIVIIGENGEPLYMAASAVDITELDKAQKDRERIFNLSPDLVCVAGYDGYFKQFNPSWTKVLGWTEEALRNKPIVSLIHPDDIELTYEQARNLKQGKTVLGAVNRYKTTNGDYRWFSWNSVSIPGTDTFMGIARDITEQRKTQEELMNSERKFRALYDNAPLSYQSLDENGNFIDVNPTWLDTLGYNREEVIGYNYADFLHPDWGPHFEKNFPTFKKRGYVSDVQFKLRHKKGNFIDVSFEGCIGYLPDGSFKQTYCVFKDITIQKQAEKALIESEAKFKSVFEFSNIGIALADSSGNIFEANDELLNLLEYERNEIKGINYYDLTHPADLQRELNLLEKVDKGELDNYRMEKRIITKSKKIKWINLGIAIRRNNEGKVELFIGMITDMTKKKEAEAELIKAKEKAEESDKLKSAFLANMSHEIRTPMNGILGFAELLEQPNLTFQQHKDYVDIIRKSGHRMLNTVNDIIDISKIDAGQVSVEKETLDVEEALNLLYAFFKPEADRKGLDLKLTSSINTSSTIIETDKTKFNSIITNLIKNAIKYTDKGRVEIKYILKAGQFICNVIDTGVGIPANRKNAVFNRFEQVDIDDEYAREGSGLGLAISKNYAELLGGEINFVSDMNIGTTFHFRLPVELSTRDEEKFDEKENRKDLNSLNILIAEDDEISFLHLSVVLKDIASNIYRAQTGPEAVELAMPGDKIDCVLMDVKLPLFDGYEACRRIRKTNKAIPIIAQTAYALEGEREKALEAGCNDYLSKPINKKLLLEKLNLHLSAGNNKQ